jgi:hypothetical protein
MVTGPSTAAANLTLLLEQFPDWKEEVPSYLATFNEVRFFT